MAASPGLLPLCLPDRSCLTLEDMSRQGDVIMMTVSATSVGCACPRCGVHSSHIHSRYSRTLRDLPCHGAVVRICLRTHRFYCRAPDCPRRIFTQRLPAVVPPHGRQTCRQRKALQEIGYALGGEAGYRLAAKLGINCSADTILRFLNQVPSAEHASDVKVLGVDDWAWRRGHRYGTVLVDLERRRPIDLLPDRESDTLARWLLAHPSVQVISRDRAGAYAEGARRGVPEAVQVADRFHLYCNLTQALQRVLERLAQVLGQVELPSDSTQSDSTLLLSEATELDGQEGSPVRDAAPPTQIQHHQERQPSREKQKARFDSVVAAYEEGATLRAISRKFGLSRTTVRRYVRTKEFLERAPRRRRSELDSFRGYLQKRWAEGCHNASQLCRELHQQGYGGGRSRVKEYVQPWRANSAPACSKPRRRTLPNLRLIALWLSKAPMKRSPYEQRWAEAVIASHPQVAAVEQLAQQFRQVFQDRDSDALKSWMKRSAASDIPELKRFAAGIERDYEAVSAAVEQHWSNGQVERQVHRLKLLKRQMYGRSGFLLLRRRVLPFTTAETQRSP
jgi:transposase